MKIVKSATPLLTLFPAQAAGMVVRQPNQIDREIAQIRLGQLMKTHMWEMEPLEVTQNVILVYFVPHQKMEQPADPVLPVVIGPTGAIYDYAFRRLSWLVCWMNQKHYSHVDHTSWYRRAKFWVNVLVRTVPLQGKEKTYFTYQLHKTLNEPWRRK